MLLDIDAGKAEVEAIPLDILENIDWDAVASDVLGIMDPIGQLRAWLESLLTGFIDTIRRAFEAIASPIRDAVNSIWSTVIAIPSAISTVIDTLRSIVVKPIQDALNWVSATFPLVVNAVSSAIKQVSDFITGLPSTISRFIDTVSSVFSYLADRIRSGFQWFVDQISRLPDYISSLIGSVSKLFSDFVDRIKAGFQWFVEQVAKLPDHIKSFIDSASRLFGDLVDRVRGGFTWFIEQVARFPDYIKSFIDSTSRLFVDLADRIRAGFSWFVDQISRLPDYIKSFIDSVSRVFGDLADRIRSGFTWFIDQVSRLPDAVRDLIGRVMGLFGELSDRVRAGFQWLVEQIYRFPDIVKSFTEYVSRFFSDLVDRVRTGFAVLLEQISRVPDVVRGLIDSVSKLFSDFVDRIKAGFQWFVEQVSRLPSIARDAISAVVGNIREGVGGVVEWVRRGFDAVIKAFEDWFRGARDWFESATRTLRGVAMALELGFQGFVNAVLRLPRELQNIFSGVLRFFEAVWSSIQGFAKDPVGWFRKNLIDPLISGLVFILGKIKDGLAAAWEAIKGALTWIWERLLDVFNIIRNAIVNAINMLMGFFTELPINAANTFKAFGMKIKNMFISVFEWMREGVSDAVSYLAKNVVEPFWNQLAISSPPGLTRENFIKAWGTSFGFTIPMYIFALSVEIPMRLMAFVAKGIAKALSEHELKIRLAIRPGGVGGEIQFDLFKAIGSALYNFSEEIMKHADKFYEPFWMGVMFWYGRFASQMITYYMRNFIPIEFPSVTDVKTAYLRARVAETIPPDLGSKPKDIIDAMTSFMKIKGYSDYLLRWTFAEPEEFYMVVRDRFNQPRKLPLADVWELPTRSDIVAMMVRDLILEPEEFEKIAAAMGYSKHVAALYYIFRFRYPSPERLANFYWRGITGVLWLDKTFEEEKIKKYFEIGKVAKAPKELNLKADKLNEVIDKYMKWHDYAPFAWENDFPTDKSIVVELMADLPDKVDFRWMARWGIFEHLSKIGVAMDSPIDDIFNKMVSAHGMETVSRRVSPEISLDVTLLARFLESRGIHPYFAAIAAVGEMHVALADEMTLLRSGFIELYRTGLIDLDTAEQLMSGLFTIKFTTGYIDPATAAPVKKDYLKPLFWLPAERRMLQLRAVMDRGYEFWRAMLREILSGVSRLGITVEEARRYIMDLSTKVSSYIASGVKALTGVDWKPVIDMDYVWLWEEYADKLRTVEIRTWIRHYVTRLMAWILYRTSYGWVKQEDFESLVDKLVDKKWLADEEGLFFKTVIASVIGLVRRETIPTPLTLASMAEYMVIDEPVIKSVFEDQRVVEEYRDLYKRYIMVKPFKSDYKTLINRARRALVLGAISKEEWDRLTSDAVSRYGFRDEEIKIQEMLADIEERIASAKEYMPTPSTVATLSEYVEIPKQLIEKVLRDRRIPSEWAQLWLRYVDVKPVKSDYRAVLSTALRALRYGAIDRDRFDKLLKAAQDYGFTAREIELIQLRTELEMLIDDAREERRAWMPSISTVITMAEYVPDAVKLLQLYRVDQRVKPYIERYAYVRPLADEARLLINELYRARRYISIPKELEDKVLSTAKQLGITDTELALRDLALELQVMVDESKTWLPTPSTLATLSEYISIPSELVYEVLKDRRVPDKWAGLWIQYIAVRPLKTDYRAVLSTALRALRYGAIGVDQWKKLLGSASMYGFKPEEINMIQMRAELELLIENAREYVPTPSTLAAMAEYVPTVKLYASQVLEARGVRGVWASLWMLYIYLRPLYDDVRRWANAMFELAEYAIIDVKQLGSVFKTLMDYGWEELEVRLAENTVLAVAVRRAWNELLGSARQLVYMSRYSSHAADFAWSRVQRIVNLLPVDENIKRLIAEMWRQYIIHYQNYPEIRSYVTELVNAYAYGIIDDKTLDAELETLRALGVPELSLSLIRRRAQLRRMRALYR